MFAHMLSQFLPFIGAFPKQDLWVLPINLSKQRGWHKSDISRSVELKTPQLSIAYFKENESWFVHLLSSFKNRQRFHVATVLF